MKNIELVLNKKYTLGKRVFWFLFFKHSFKPFLALLVFGFITYFINTDMFYDWLISQDVASIEDLIEAFGIEEFVQSGMQRTGLKVSNLTNCLSCML